MTNTGNQTQANIPQRYASLLEDPWIVDVKISGIYESVVLSQNPEISRKEAESGVGYSSKGIMIGDIRPKNKGQEDVVTQAKKYTQGFAMGIPRKSKNGLFIHGAIGTGKTYIVSAIANTLIYQGLDVLMTSQSAMMDRIRRGDLGEIGPSNRFLTKCLSYDVLIIDDLGKDKPTEYTMSQLFRILDQRVSDLLPTIITSNHSLQDLVKQLTPDGGELTRAYSMADRIHQACQTLVLSGKSVRR